MITGRYGIMFLSIILFFCLKKIEHLIFSDNIIEALKGICYEVLKKLFNNIKLLIGSFLLAKISFYLPFFQKFMGKINIFLKMLPIIKHNRYTLPCQN
jgi:hypothetical protein